MNLTERYRQIESVTKYSNYYLGRCYTWLSTPITEFAARIGLHPNAMTLISLVLGLTACGFFLVGDRVSLLIGAIILYVSYVLDWSDGQLARFTGKMSPFGGWLDQMSDRFKEFAYISTLAIGSHRLTDDVTVFYWAMGALFLLFLLEYYGQINRSIPASKNAQESAAAATPSTPQFGRPSDGRRKIVIDFSIDEQYAVVCLLIVLVGAKGTLVGVTSLALLFAVYKPLKAWLRYFRTN